ncbi:MAG: dihydrolipoyl dehydrogenase [Anaerolineales bacterium]
MGEFTQDTELVVIGGGPGGYAAAFRAADLGLDVTMVNLDERPGGVCLFRGCIPTKALLYLTHVLNDARDMENLGIHFEEPEVELDKVRSWKERVVNRLTRGLMTLTKQRKIQYLQARAIFENSNTVRLEGEGVEISRLKFENAIIATGSRPRPLPGMEFEVGSRIMDSTEALNLEEIPETLLVVGGGYVGLELGSVYATLGSKVTVVEMLDRLLPMTDSDLVKPLIKRIQQLFEKSYTSTKVADMQEHDDYVEVTLEGEEVAEQSQRFDKVLVAIGRLHNSDDLGLENTKVEVQDDGAIAVDEQRRTADPHIYAIGDVVGGAMLAHKAMREGKVAAEAIAGEPAAYDVRAIPAVVYTDPQIAWAGVLERDAQEQGREVKVARFPWTASGRAVTMEATEGLTKLVLEPETERVIGMGIVGRDAGELIGEGVLAIEMGAVAEDLALTVHPHPTLSETEGEAAEAFLGEATHILAGKSKRKKK